MVLVHPDYKPPCSDIDCSAIVAADLQMEYITRRPLGFCVYIGVPRSVIGNYELERIIFAVNNQHCQVQRSLS